MTWSIERKIVAGVTITLTVLAINAFVSYRATRKLMDNELQVSHRRQVLTELESTLSTVVEGETGERGYIITGEEPYLAPYETALEDVSKHLGRLEQLTASEPGERANVALLEARIAKRLQSLRSAVALRRHGDIGG